MFRREDPCLCSCSQQKKFILNHNLTPALAPSIIATLFHIFFICPHPMGLEFNIATLILLFLHTFLPAAPHPITVFLWLSAHICSVSRTEYYRISCTSAGIVLALHLSYFTIYTAQFLTLRGEYIFFESCLWKCDLCWNLCFWYWLSCMFSCIPKWYIASILIFCWLCTMH